MKNQKTRKQKDKKEETKKKISKFWILLVCSR